jgi:uncharacterized protein
VGLPPHIRSIAGAALAAGALLVLGASSLLAASPTLTDQITDETGVIGGERARVQQSLDDLFVSEALRLWVELVPTTEGALAQDVARQHFVDNAFGPNDMLLVVAVNDHRYGWWERTATGTDRGTATSMTSYEVDALLSAALDPNFRAGDYAGGVISLAKAMTVSVRMARTSTPAPSRMEFGGYDPVDEPSGSSDIDGLMSLLMIGGVLGIIALAAFTSSGESGGRGWTSGGSSGSSSSSSWSSSSSSSSSSGHGGGGGWSGGSSGSSGGHGGGGGW